MAIPLAIAAPKPVIVSLEFARVDSLVVLECLSRTPKLLQHILRVEVCYSCFSSFIMWFYANICIGTLPESGECLFGSVSVPSSAHERVQVRLPERVVDDVDKH